MSKKIALIKNTLVIFVGKACTQFISLLLLPLYTAILNTSEYGIVDLITTYVSLLVPIITLQLETAIFRFLVDNREDGKKQSIIITNGFIGCLVLFLIVFIISLIINYIIQINYFYLIVVMIFCTILSNFMLQVMRGLGDNLSYSIGCTITGVSIIILNLIFLLIIKMGINGMLLATAIANLLCYIFLFFKIKMWRILNLRLYKIREIIFQLKYSLPLVPNGLIWWIINVSDRTIISLVLGASANGIYAVSNKFSTILIQIYSVFNLSWTESASIHIKDNDKDEFFSSTFNEILKVFSTLGIFMITLIPFIFPVMIAKDFIEAKLYIPLLVISVIFNIIVSFIGGIYVAEKQTKEIAKTSLISGILNILINLIMINKVGIHAAAISTIVAFAIMSIYRYFDVKKYVNIKLEKKTSIIIGILYVIVIFIYNINNIIGNIINIIVAIVFSIYLNRNIIEKVKKIYINKFYKVY